MAKSSGDRSLVIVESPTKARTLKKYLGEGVQVLASVGHIKDLPKNDLGVDVDKGFAPTYELIRGKKKVIQELVAAASKSDKIYLAPDPDREGEAIAWHVAEEISHSLKGKKRPSIYRALFHEITKRAVQEALDSPSELNQNLYEAQQARRILDRLVGYQISPLLWDKVRRGLSAGRVQSVAVRIISEREEEVENFIPKEYWSITADLLGSLPPNFLAKLTLYAGEKIEIGNELQANQIVDEIKGEPFRLTKVTRKERKRYPLPPFITSRLQQDAARRLGFAAKRTMMIAQRLYEGIDVGEEGPVGLITYMRTDSTRVAGQALEECRKYIFGRFGKEYLPDHAIQYKPKKEAQGAHEAIRPTSLEYPPERVANFLEPDLLKLYELIWNRFVASQMNPAIFDQTAFDIEVGKTLFRAAGSQRKFDGYLKVYEESLEEESKEEKEEAEGLLPDLKEGEILKLQGLLPKQHFTQPPPRYTEASLIKALEELGIGRPSTYAQILTTIVGKEYVQKEEGKLRPTSLGKLVNGLLVKHFPEILNVKFTAQMEEELDEVEEGRRPWVQALTDFYTPFRATLDQAKMQMENIKRMQVETHLKCEKCGAPMVIRWGRHGEFLACSRYPECRSTHEFHRDSEGSIVLESAEVRGQCEVCGASLLMKRGRFGPFLACSKYPECKFTKPISTGVVCPRCGGEIVQRRSRRGKYFYGCSKYPQCEFALWAKPLPEACPQCKHPYLVEKYSKKLGAYVSCPEKSCGYTREPE